MGNLVYSVKWDFQNWTTAVESCKQEGLELAFPKSPEENAQLLKDITTAFDRHPNARKFSHDNWVGI